MNRTVLLAALLLAACTSADTGSGTALPGYNPTQAEASQRVRIMEQSVETSGRTMNVSATICRKNPLDPPPTRERALALLQLRTLQNGFLAVHSVEAGPVTGSLQTSCKGGMRAQGVGFTAS